MSAAARIAIACLLLAVSAALCAVPETELGEGAGTKVADYMAAHARTGTLATADGATLAYQRIDSRCSDTALVIVPGWTESYLKYDEVIYDLRHHRWCIYVLDHRGQGLSTRAIANTQVGYIDEFAQYVRDLELFDRRVVRSKPHRRVFFLAHSMGGLVTTLYAANETPRINGLALSAPLFEVNGGWAPEWLAWSISWLLDSLGFGTSYVPGHSDWRESRWLFENNRVTHSRVRFARAISLWRADPELIVSGASNRWLQTTIEASRQVTAAASRVTVPVLLLQADDDDFVKLPRQKTFCAAARNCRRHLFLDAKHELLMERDRIRNEALARIVQFVSGTP
ncbi:MAG: alpha/beta fold hydrolase [Pseudomonadota bacterium]|nr:MAG: alpha/beta fold hydrolase [Pseudomonadota bacterium]